MTEIIERLSFHAGTKYSATEAAIHLSRYLPARRYCAGKRVLDVACGEGYGAFALAERWSAAAVDAVDVSADAIAGARQNFASPKVEYHCASAEQLSASFAPAIFDVVVSFETVEHVEDAAGFLADLGRLAKTDGVVLVSCPNDHWYYPQPEQRNPYHRRKYTFAEFRALAEGELGPATDWLFGWPVGGFVNVGREVRGATEAGAPPRSIVEGAAVEALTVATDETLTEGNCSYFLGVWDRRAAGARREAPSAVFHPCSMDAFASRWAADSLRDELDRAKTELWNSTHRGDLRPHLISCVGELDALTASVGLSDGARGLPSDERDDGKLVELLHTQVRRLRDMAADVGGLRTKLRNAELHRQAAEIENRLMRERVQQLLAAQQVPATALPRLTLERGAAFARQQVARARGIAGGLVRRLRGR
ncbi:MAG: class I SAM-dependent methyltransferase [Planctomycetota bacterium]